MLLQLLFAQTFGLYEMIALSHFTLLFAQQCLLIIHFIYLFLLLWFNTRFNTLLFLFLS